MKRTNITPQSHSKPIGCYSPGVAVSLEPGDTLLFLTGQVATDTHGGVLCPNDPAGQAEVIFQRLNAILAEAGGGISDLTCLNIFVTQQHYFRDVSNVRNRWLSDVNPASTMVVSKLMEDGCMVEINGVAVIGNRPS